MNDITPKEILQSTEKTRPDLIEQIGSTTFDIYVHFSSTSKETFEDKVVRLIQKNVD